MKCALKTLQGPLADWLSEALSKLSELFIEHLPPYFEFDLLSTDVSQIEYLESMVIKNSLILGHQVLDPCRSFLSLVPSSHMLW